jgi:hypothetical protein
VTYLASPYSHPDPAVRERRYRAACRATAEMLRAGEVVFSPVVHSHPLVPYGLPTGWEYWERFDRAVLTRCDAVTVLTLDGWEDSAGVQAEVAIAGELGLPIQYVGVDVANGTPTLAHGSPEGGG